MLARLRHRRVVDHHHRISAANELISLDEKLSLQRSRAPNTSRNKMVQPIIAVWRKPLGDGRNALAITRPDQSCDVKRTHPLPRLVTQAFQERFEPTAKLIFPIRPRALHGRPSTSRTTHESPKNRFGNPSRRKNCQSSA